MPSIAVIANPNSRKNRKNPGLIPALEAQLGDRGELIATPSLEALDEAAHALRQRAPQVVGLCGGDGTIHAGLTALHRAYGEAPLPIIALLCGGTMNTVATGLGLKGAPKAVLAKLLEQEAQGSLPTLEVGTLKVEDRLGFLFGTGLMARFLEVYYDGGDASPWKAVKVLSSVVGSAAVGGPLIKRLTSNAEVQVIADGEPWGPAQPYDMIGAGTSPSLAFFFRPFYRALDLTQTFQVWGVGCGPWELSKKLGRIARALPPEHPRITDVEVTHLKLVGEELSYQFDGELYPAQGELEVTLGPRLRLFCPE